MLMNILMASIISNFHFKFEKRHFCMSITAGEFTRYTSFFDILYYFRYNVEWLHNFGFFMIFMIVVCRSLENKGFFLIISKVSLLLIWMEWYFYEQLDFWKTSRDELIDRNQSFLLGSLLFLTVCNIGKGNRDL